MTGPEPLVTGTTRITNQKYESLILDMDDLKHTRPSKFWLVLSYFANIDGKAASQHLDDRVPHLRSLGIEPLILSSICGERNPELAHFTVPSLSPSGVRFELRYLRRRNRTLKLALLPFYLVILPLYFIEKLLLNLDSQWSWFPMGFLRGLRLCKALSPEVIYSTGGPVSAHIAAALLAHFTKIPWIAEIQDPLVHEAVSRGKAALIITAAVERLILGRASAIVYLTDAARKLALARTGADPSKVHVIYPGAAPPRLEPFTWTKTEVCRFAHFGSLGGPRNVGTFLDALDRIVAADSELKDRVRLDLYGTMDEVSRKQIAAFKYPGMITDFGKVPRQEALRAMQKSDILLLIQQRDALSFYTIPSKIYEYFQVNRPILGLVFRNPGLVELLKKYGHFTAEADSSEETTLSVLEIIRNWRTSGLESKLDPSVPFTIAAAVQKLVDVSQELTSPKPAAPRT